MVMQSRRAFRTNCWSGQVPRLRICHGNVTLWARSAVVDSARADGNGFRPHLVTFCAISALTRTAVGVHIIPHHASWADARCTGIVVVVILRIAQTTRGTKCPSLMPDTWYSFLAYLALGTRSCRIRISIRLPWCTINARINSFASFCTVLSRLATEARRLGNNMESVAAHIKCLNAMGYHAQLDQSHRLSCLVGRSSTSCLTVQNFHTSMRKPHSQRNCHRRTGLYCSMMEVAQVVCCHL